MAYNIVNGPIVMKSFGTAAIDIVVNLIYDDAERTTECIRVSLGDIVRIKYLNQEYYPRVEEIVGKISSYSLRKEPSIPDKISGLGVYESLSIDYIQIDLSKDMSTEVKIIPVAAIREIEEININGSGEKPDCDDPGTNCPFNPGCSCPGHTDNGCCQKPNDSVPNPEPPKEDDDLDESIKCIVDCTKFTSLESAIEYVNSASIENPEIKIVNTIDRLKDEQAFVINKGMTIRSICCDNKAKINGSFIVNSSEPVVFEDLIIVHNGARCEYSGIETVNAGITVNNVDFVLEDGYEVSPTDTTLPRAITISKLISKEGELPVSLSNITLKGYCEYELGDALSTAIVISRNIKNLYGDFELAKVDYDSIRVVGDLTPHFLISDQDFHGSENESELTIVSSVLTAGGLHEALLYQDTIIVPPGVILDLEMDEFSFTLNKDTEFIIKGIFSLGKNSITNNGTIKIKDNGLFINGLIIDNGTIVKENALPNAFLGTKQRVNGQQKFIDESKL